MAHNASSAALIAYEEHDQTATSDQMRLIQVVGIAHQMRAKDVLMKLDEVLLLLA